MYRHTGTHKSVDSVSLPSQPPHTFLCAPHGLVPPCTILARPTDYFQQLGFGLCHPCARQADLPSLCPLSAKLSSVPTLAGKLLKNTRLATEAAGGGGSEQCFIDTAGRYIRAPTTEKFPRPR